MAGWRMMQPVIGQRKYSGISVSAWMGGSGGVVEVGELGVEGMRRGGAHGPQITAAFALTIQGVRHANRRRPTLWVIVATRR